MAKMKVDEALVRRDILALVPLAELDAAVRTTVTLDVVAYGSVARAFEEEMAEVLQKLKPEGFDERLEKFAAAVEKPATDEQLTEEQLRKIEELKADADFPAFREEYDKVTADYVAARRRAAETKEYDVCEYPLRDHLPAIAAVLPVGGSQKPPRDGEEAPRDGEEVKPIDNQQLFAWVAEIAHKQNK